MNRILVKAKVGDDGVLRLEVTIGAAEGNQEVQVTVEPVATKAPMSQEEWRAFVLATAGSIADPTFERPPQSE